MGRHGAGPAPLGARLRYWAAMAAMFALGALLVLLVMAGGLVLMVLTP